MKDIEYKIKYYKPKQNKMKSWKTTSAGILLVIGGVYRLVSAIKSGSLNEESITTSVAAILGGIGLMFAKDGNVTGGTIQQ